MINAVGRPAKQRMLDDMSEVVRMDMIGVDIILRQQGRQAFLQTLYRQPLADVNAGHAQDGQARMRTPGPGAQTLFRIDTPPGTQVKRKDRARLIELRAWARRS